MIKNIICFFVTIAFVTKSSAQNTLELVKNGKSDYKIIIPPDANEIEKQSAVVFQDYINRISGCLLPVFKQNPLAKGKQIIIGRSKLINSASLQELGNDGFIMRIIDNSLILTGGTRKGVLYGVYTFLEDYLGCRMYTSKVIYIPKNNSIILPATIDKKQTPTFKYRSTYFTDALNKDYCDFHKMNYFMEDWGLWVHSFSVLVPKEKYFKTNPTYFALVNGQRTTDQLCLTNPAVVTTVTENLRKLIKEKPGAKYWSVSQNDNDNFCQCNNCKKLNEEQGSFNGSVLSFVNNVAKYFPDKTITTLAYRNTETPPKTLRPLPNVLVMLCTAYDERRVPLREQTNVSFYGNFKNWAAITKELFIWDYIVPFAHALSPFPNYYTIQPNIQYFASRNATQIFLNGIGDFHGEFSELRCYLASRLMWNKDIDVKATIEEFITGYYGKVGGAYISRYIAMLDKNARSKPVGVRSGGEPLDAINSYLSPENIDAYKVVFEDAIKVTSGTVYNNRIITEYLSVLYAELEINKALSTKDKKTMSSANRVNTELLNNFYKKMKQLNLIYLNESWLQVDDYYKGYLLLLSK
ncbi:MAG TPA: DUF4838 domain-containing protein [Segetibacter sp.]